MSGRRSSGRVGRRPPPSMDIEDSVVPQLPVPPRPQHQHQYQHQHQHQNSQKHQYDSQNQLTQYLLFCPYPTTDILSLFLEDTANDQNTQQLDGAYNTVFSNTSEDYFPLRNTGSSSRLLQTSAYSFQNTPLLNQQQNQPQLNIQSQYLQQMYSSPDDSYSSNSSLNASLASEEAYITPTVPKPKGPKLPEWRSYRERSGFQGLSLAPSNRQVSTESQSTILPDEYTSSAQSLPALAYTHPPINSNPSPGFTSETPASYGPNSAKGGYFDYTSPTHLTAHPQGGVSPQTSYQSSQSDYEEAFVPSGYQNQYQNQFSPEGHHDSSFTSEPIISETSFSETSPDVRYTPESQIQKLSSHSIRTIQSDYSYTAQSPVIAISQDFVSHSDSLHSRMSVQRSVQGSPMSRSPGRMNTNLTLNRVSLDRNSTLYAPYNFYNAENVESNYPSYENDNYNDNENENLTEKGLNLVDLDFPELPSSDSDSEAEGEGDVTRMADILDYETQESPNRSGSLATAVTDIELPSIKGPPVTPPLILPKLEFSATSLHSQHFLKCRNVSYMSSLFEWSLLLCTWSNGETIKRKEYRNALRKLLGFHRKDVPVDVILRNADQIMRSFAKAGAILYDLTQTEDADNKTQKDAQSKKQKKDESIVVFNTDAEISGFLPDLALCYSYARRHDSKETLRCFSNTCFFNRKLEYEQEWKNMDINNLKLGSDWEAHWKWTANELKQLDLSMIKRQSHIFELFKNEQSFNKQAKIFINDFAPKFIQIAEKLLGPKNIILVSNIRDDMLQPTSIMYEIHREKLFLPLLQILKDGGRFITDVTGIVDLYCEWANEVRPHVLKYAETVPYIEGLMMSNALKKWVDELSRLIPSLANARLDGSMLLRHAFNTRFFRLPDGFKDVRKSYEESDPEYAALSRAKALIESITSEINEVVRKSENRFALKGITKRLVWGVRRVDLRLNSSDRRFVFKGDLKKKDLVTKSSAHLILLDNYLLITETMYGDSFKVVEPPIPTEYLLIEDRKKDATEPIQLKRPTTTTSLQDQSDAQESDVFSFKVRYAGHDKSYIFSTKQEREKIEWLRNLQRVRTIISSKLQKVQVFDIKPISNTCFAYDLGNRVLKLQLCADKDPIEAMCTEAYQYLKSLDYRGDLYNFPKAFNSLEYGKVTCATSVVYQGQKFYFVGMPSGVYCTDLRDRWKKVASQEASKMEADPKSQILVVMCNKSLKYYLLKLLIEIYIDKKEYKTCVTLDRSLVNFFEMAPHNGMMTLFVAKKKSNSATNFKVMVPGCDKRGVFSSFKDVKKFYVQAECYGISIFNLTFAVHTQKGFEILALANLIPQSIPILPQTFDSNGKKLSATTVANIQYTIDSIRKSVLHSSVKPMGVYKLANDHELMLVYNDFAIFTDKRGVLSRYYIHRFEFKADSVAFVGNYLVLVCDQVIEVWAVSMKPSVSNMLMQVVVGKDIRRIGSRQELYFAMANPKVPGLQCVFELEQRRSI